MAGGPVGIETLAAALSEPRDAIEEIIEPYLLQQGLIARTPRGRMLTAQGFAHLGLPAPAQNAAQFPLFNGTERSVRAAPFYPSPLWGRWPTACCRPGGVSCASEKFPPPGAPALPALGEG